MEVEAATPLDGTIATLAEILRDGVFTDGDWVESKDQDPNGDVRLIQLADVGDGVFRNRSARFLTLSKARELRCTFLEPGDILVARMPEPLGRACIFPGLEQPAVTVVDVCVLRPNRQRIQPEWLMNAINAPEFRSAMQRFVRGTTRQRISRRNLGSLSLRLPTPSQQTAQAERLARIAAMRQSAAGHISAASVAAASLRDAVLAAACSGRLTTDWRSGGPAGYSGEEVIRRSKALRGERRPPRQGDLPSANPDWIDLPTDWVWAPLSDLADIRGGIQKQPKRAPKEHSYPYLRVANVKRGALDLTEVHCFELFSGELELYRLERGDLLVVEGNGSPSEIGRSALWQGQIENCVHQNHIIRVRCAKMEPRFLALFWNSRIASREIAALAVTSSGLYSLSVRKIASVRVPVPPLAEQQEIVRRASELLTLTDGIRERVRKARRSLLLTTGAVQSMVVGEALRSLTDEE